MKPNCYACQFRGEVPGSAHSSCKHPATAPVFHDPIAQAIGLLGKRSGETLIPSAAARELNIRAASLGVRRGWFLWPLNFDPVWLENCEGYQAVEQSAEAQPASGGQS